MSYLGDTAICDETLTSRCCTDGPDGYPIYHEPDGRGPLDFIDALNACGRARGWVNTPQGLSQMIEGANRYRERGRAGISDRIYNAIMKCGNEVMCAGYADEVTRRALEERDRINEEIETGGPQQQYDGTPDPGENLDDVTGPPGFICPDGTVVAGGPNQCAQVDPPESAPPEVDPATGQRYCPSLYPHGRIDNLNQLVCWSEDPDAWRRHTTPGNGSGVPVVTSPGASVGNEPGNGGQFYFGTPAGAGSGGGNFWQDLPTNAVDLATDEWIGGIPNWATLAIAATAGVLVFRGKK